TNELELLLDYSEKIDLLSRRRRSVSSDRKLGVHVFVIEAYGVVPKHSVRLVEQRPERIEHHKLSVVVGRSENDLALRLVCPPRRERNHLARLDELTKANVLLPDTPVIPASWDSFDVVSQNL